MDDQPGTAKPGPGPGAPPPGKAKPRPAADGGGNGVYGQDMVAIRAATYSAATTTLTVTGTCTGNVRKEDLSCDVYRDLDGTQISSPILTQTSGPSGAAPGRWAFTFTGPLAPDVIVLVYNSGNVSDQQYVQFS